MLQKQIALIIGSSCLLSVPFAEKLEQQGYIPVLTTRNVSCLNSRNISPRCIILHTLDFMNPNAIEYLISSVKSICEKTSARLAKVFYLAAHLATSSSDILESEEDMKIYYRVNRDVPYELASYFLKEDSSIEFIYLSTPAIRTKTGLKGFEAYTFSKKQGDRLMNLLCIEHPDYQITFFYPSQIKGSDCQKNYLQDTSTGLLRKIFLYVSQKFMKTPEQLADVFFKKSAKGKIKIYGDFPAWLVFHLSPTLAQFLCR